MKTLKQIFDIIEESDITINDYLEDDNLCGYELNTYTDGGVNEIIFLDFRNEGQDPENVNDFIKEFESYIDDYSVDDKIDMYRQDSRYRNDFTISESLKDFTNFNKKLKKLLKKISK